MDKIRLLFLFHMHQPVYRLRKDGKKLYYMPWVYLHGIREYYDVARVIEESEGVKIVVNFVPTLIEQLQDYIDGNYEDVFLEHFKKDASLLTQEEVTFILENFFSINYNSKLKHSRRYLYLLDKRGSPYDIEKKVKRFTTQEIRDLQMLFYLYNTSVTAEEEFPLLKELKNKDHSFTEREKDELLKIHNEILRRVIPLYKALMEKGKIDITFTPYAHPIAPLLIDSKCAEISNPYTLLPDATWKFPQNAERQVKQGKEFIKSVFGVEPVGMWPSEGSVSEEFIKMIAKHNVKWTATDEGILEKSLGYVIRTGAFPAEIYELYEFSGVRMLFRDRELSDNLGFDLYKLKVNEGVGYFVDKVQNIAEKGGKIVSVILDGENPWENYEKGGVPFLRALFKALVNSGLVEFVTGRDLLEFDTKSLKRLHPGSWIRADFTTWIGHKEKNRAWEYLVKVKKDVAQEVLTNQEAEKELMYAEGSDWFWWYGDDNPTFYKSMFDFLYRSHLKEVYRLLGKAYPGFLDIPISENRAVSCIVEEESDFISPKIDGRINNFFEWLGAGVVDLTRGQGGVMQRQSLSLSRMLFGRDEHNVYIRIEGRDGLDMVKGRFRIEFFNKNGEKVMEALEGEFPDCVRGKVFECRFPLNMVTEDNVLRLAINIIQDEVQEERYPQYGFYMLPLITPEKLEEDWLV